MGRGQQEQAASSALFTGAATLGVAAVISKLLGTLQKIPLQNIAGDEAFGIYNVVYPFYTLVLLLATAGFPVAVSTFVSERMASGREAEANRVLRLSAILLSALGLVAFIVLYAGAEQVAAWVDNSQIVPSIRSVAFALLFVPLMSAIRGYFQGRQNMLPTGVSQIGEQAVRVATMIALILWLTAQDAGTDQVAAGAMFGSVTGAIAGLAIVIGYYARHRSSRRRSSAPAPASSVQAGASHSGWSRQQDLDLMRRLALYALPVCLGAIVMPVLHIVDTFTLPRLLKGQGLSDLDAMAAFGVYSRGLPLVQLVTMLFSSVSVALVPAFAEAKSRRQWTLIRSRAEFAFRLTWLIGLAASIGLAVCARPINVMMYTNTTGTVTMSILAFSAVFSVIHIVTAAMLQGLGHVRTPAVHLLVAAILKVVLNIGWVPLWGVNGAACAAVVAFAVAAVLNVIAWMKAASVRLRWHDYVVRPLVPLSLMLIWVLAVMYGLDAAVAVWSWPADRGTYTAAALTAVAGGGALYVYAMFRFGGISVLDLRRFPVLWHRMPAALKRRMDSRIPHDT